MDGETSSQDERYHLAASEFGPALERLARAYEANPDQRHDLLQDIHTALWRSFAGYDGRCSLRTWVYRVAHNVGASHVIRRRRIASAKWVGLDDLNQAADGDNPEQAVAEGASMLVIGRAVTHAGDPVKAARALQAALKVNPHDVNAHQWRGAILMHLGFYEQALLDVSEVLAITPNAPLALANIAYIAGDTGDHEKSLDYYERAFRADPTLIHPNILFPTGEIYAGNLGEARVKLARGRQMVPEEPQLDAAESVLFALEGTTDKALELVDRALAGKPRLHTHHTWYFSAVTFALCGQPEKAIQWLGECAGMGLPNPHLFANDPHLKSLQGIPEFRVLLADVRQQSDQLRAEFGFR